MTLPRRNKKALPTLSALQKLWIVGLCASLAVINHAHASTNERVVVNRHSGLVIDGYDPVAYFTDGRPVPGSAEVELIADGAVWRFHTPSNRAFFVAHPDVYRPQFGGYDPVDMARGVSYAGQPQFWLIFEQRLYLFGREESREQFAAAPQEYLEEARRSWRSVQHSLAR